MKNKKKKRKKRERKETRICCLSYTSNLPLTYNN